MSSKYDDYELESLLYEVKEIGFVFVNKYKLWRILGKGSGAAGTWKLVLDTWQEIDGKNARDALHGFEIGTNYLISMIATTPLEGWAGER